MQVVRRFEADGAALRVSLKRGLARQALDHAGRDDANLPGLFAQVSGLAPNAKAIERLAGRVARVPGVVQVSRANGGAGLVIVARSLRHMVNTVNGGALFDEVALVYTRIHLRPGRNGTTLYLHSASFCRHALERLVERSSVALNLPLLPAIDAEAVRLLRHQIAGRVIEDAGDNLIRAGVPGVWAGGFDLMLPEQDWGLILQDGASRVPVFSVRSFLAPAQMRPTLWLKWKDDPAMQMAA